MTNKAYLAGTLFAAATSIPAAADFVTTSPDVLVEGWQMHSVQDTANGKPKWCQITAPVTDKGYSFTANFGQKVPVDARVVQNEIILSNRGWDLAADSGGTVVVELSKVSRSIEFRRSSSSEVTTPNLPGDETTNGWLAGGLTATIIVRFPNGESFSVPPGGDAVALAAFGCLAPLYRN